MIRETTEQEKEVFSYLNDLRDSGITNMFSSPQYVNEEFGIEKPKCRELVSLWMKNFNKDGNYEKIEVPEVVAE